VYCSESPATALLETLVHLEVASLDELPVSYQLLEIGLRKGIRAKRVGRLPPDWKDQLALTRDLGTRWLSEGVHVALRVPSAVVAQSWNVLLNPRLLPGHGIEIVSATRYPFDGRLIKALPKGSL
jgi:RES domain-containing protein